MGPWQERLGLALGSAKRVGKRAALSLGSARLVQAAVEFLRAAEPEYSRETLDLLTRDVLARTNTARKAQLCAAVLDLWGESPLLPPYALKVLRVVESALSTLNLSLADDLAVCELGPGDSLCVAGLIVSRGSRYVGVDPWPPVLEPTLYALAERHFVEEAGLDLSAAIDSSGDPVRCSDRLKRETSSEGVAAESMDFVFSIAVLEHVRDHEQVLAEIFRVLRPGGYALHQIDYEDHRDPGPAGWDFLRFSHQEWEDRHRGELARDYTNRVRHSRWLASLRALGFEIVSVAETRREPPADLPVHADLLPLAEGDLEIQSSQIVVRKPLDLQPG